MVINNLPLFMISGKKLTNNESNKQLICLPSSSASAERITLSYLDLEASQAPPIPAPMALAISQISLFFIALL